MFIFDFVAETVLDQIIDWLYGKIVGFLNDFFAMMNNMGVELFDLPWVNAITTFFGWLGWALFVVGLVVLPSSSFSSLIFLPFLILYIIQAREANSFPFRFPYILHRIAYSVQIVYP